MGRADACRVPRPGPGPAGMGFGRLTSGDRAAWRPRRGADRRAPDSRVRWVRERSRRAGEDARSSSRRHRMRGAMNTWALQCHPSGHVLQRLIQEWSGLHPARPGLPPGEAVNNGRGDIGALAERQAAFERRDGRLDVSGGGEVYPQTTVPEQYCRSVRPLRPAVPHLLPRCTPQ